jgi:uncharacterized protein (TIGR03435 family)
MRTIMLSGLLVSIGCAQTFEVASVKISPPAGEGLSAEMSEGPGRVDFNCVTLLMLMTRAYGVKDFQVTGPDWITLDRYNVTATTSPHANREQIGQMLQALLADRFQMRMHHENKELPVSALVVAKNGPKMAKSVRPPEEAGMRINMGAMEARAVTMPNLAGGLARLLGRPVLDMTGLEGSYDFDLKFKPEPGMGIAMMKMSKEVERRGGDASESNPSIFTALPEQLGLRLEQRKAPLDIIVVDHAERIPTEN